MPDTKAITIDKRLIKYNVEMHYLFPCLLLSKHKQIKWSQQYWLHSIEQIYESNYRKETSLHL